MACSALTCADAGDLVVLGAWYRTGFSAAWGNVWGTQDLHRPVTACMVCGWQPATRKGPRGAALSYRAAAIALHHAGIRSERSHGRGVAPQGVTGSRLRYGPKSVPGPSADRYLPGPERRPPSSQNRVRGLPPAPELGEASELVHLAVSAIHGGGGGVGVRMHVLAWAALADALRRARGEARRDFGIERQDSRSVELGSRFSQEAIAMADVWKAVPWRSCPNGHVYLGRECPCEHADHYRASSRQVASDGSGLETDRVPGSGASALAGRRQMTVEPP
jgi:hypothetical protein